MLLELWRFHAAALLAGCVIDWIAGDPLWAPHPVRAMGKMIWWLEQKLRKLLPRQERLGGGILTLLMCLFWTGAPVLIFYVIGRYGRGVLFVVEAFCSSQLLAAKGLYAESAKVGRELKKGDMESARKAVSMIVGRDTAVLDEAGIIRAAVETVGENASDGVIAPFLYMAVFGPAGGYFYKAVNTMDSMIGYKNDKYLLFGSVAARLDDLANFIPARLTGILLALVSALFPWADSNNSFRILWRDRRKHASPNSAHGEAACAGALHIRLAGDAWYFGHLHKKPWIGDDDRPICPEDITRAGILMFASEAVMMAAVMLAVIVTL